MFLRRRARAKKKTQIYTRSASDVHGFEVAGFDDAHSDGVGRGVVAQRHQQITSAPLEKLNTTTKVVFTFFYGRSTLVSLPLLGVIPLFCFFL